MNESTNATDRNLILAFLARVDRRLRLNEALEGLGLGYGRDLDPGVSLKREGFHVRACPALGLGVGILADE